MPLDQARVLERMNAELRSHVGALQMLMAKAMLAEWERLHDALVMEHTRLVAESEARGQDT